MWPDNETNKDFLNFTGIADTVSEIIIQAGGQPVSIGVSGAWGVGKSSMIKLIQQSLQTSDNGEKYVFVEFNAWLYQGYDDVRAALLETIANKLVESAENDETALEKAKDLLRRVNWLRVGRYSVEVAAALAFGIPPVGLMSDVYRHGRSFSTGHFDAETVKKAMDNGAEALNKTDGLMNDKPVESPPQEIQAIRDSFEEALRKLDVTLVVLIDDLDRCLPETTISALEAIRLFLFLDNTAFVIAADKEMIKHAVRRHFEGVDEEHVTNYFDKLIQVPIQVPPLGTQEVRAYLLMLYVENSSLDPDVKEQIRVDVCKQLAGSWQGKRVDRSFMDSMKVDFPQNLVARFDTADRLARTMTTASKIKGNPRLIKRFLNALSIRMSLARANGIAVDEAVLAKLLLFERCGTSAAYRKFITIVNENSEGRAEFLAEYEGKTGKEPIDIEEPWNDPFFVEWLALSPKLASLDLRGAIYVSRENIPLITPEDALSLEGSEILSALLDQPGMAATLSAKIQNLPKPELAVILDRLLERAGTIQEWGAPAELEACIVVARADENLGARVAAFLSDRPDQQVTAAVVPKISGEPWAEDVYTKWISSAVSNTVKTAIRDQRENGNL